MIEPHKMNHENSINYSNGDAYYISFIGQFQNLPELQLLDLAYNSLLAFDFNMCDQVKMLFHKEKSGKGTNERFSYLGWHFVVVASQCKPQSNH